MKNSFIIYYTEAVHIPSDLKDKNILFIPIDRKSSIEYEPFSGFLLDYADYTYLTDKKIIGDSKSSFYGILKTVKKI